MAGLGLLPSPKGFDRDQSKPKRSGWVKKPAPQANRLPKLELGKQHKGAHRAPGSGPLVG